MSIFVRPVREQAEHDRLIRFLQARYKRKFDVATNVADEQLAPVRIGQSLAFPDLVLTSDRKLAGVVEVESAESVNHLEVMAEWVPYSRAKAPFHLYVPVPAFDAARRLCESHQAPVTELWTYRPTMDGFDLVRMLHAPHTASAAGEGRRKPKAAARKAPAPKGRAAAPKTRTAKAASRASKAPKAGKSARTAASGRASRKPAASTARPARRPAARTARPARSRTTRAAGGSRKAATKAAGSRKK